MRRMLALLVGTALAQLDFAQVTTQSVSVPPGTADAPPLGFETNQTNDAHSMGFLASYLIFPTPGCWEVNAQVGDRLDSKITFVTRVEKVGDGPAWRR